MTDLPPDPPRLRALLGFLERRIAENDTIGTYLRIEHDKIQKALARAERPPQRHRPRRPVKDSASPASTPAPSRSGYVVTQKRSPQGLGPPVIHLAGCTVSEGVTRWVSPDEARAALADPGCEPCPRCRPDTGL